MSWPEQFDAFALRHPSVAEFTSPSFRLSILQHWTLLDPRQNLEPLKALLELFRPTLEPHCERIVLRKTPTAKGRPRKLKPDDWQAFDVLAEQPGEGFGSFIIQSGVTDPDYWATKGPAMARFVASAMIFFDLHVPASAFSEGLLDIPAIKEQLHKLPYAVALMGNAVCLGESFESALGDQMSTLAELAAEQPLVDVLHPYRRNWDNRWSDDPHRIWHAGVDWLTGVGEPFLSRMGGDGRLVLSAPDGVTAEAGEAGVLFQMDSPPATGSGSLTPYFALGELLAPPAGNFPNAEHRPYTPFGSLIDKDLGLAWHRRFYDGPDGEWWVRTQKARAQ